MAWIRMLLQAALVALIANAIVESTENVFHMPYKAATMPLYGITNSMLAKLNTSQSQAHRAQVAADSDYERYFTNKQDHFDGSNSNKYQQRYFKNTQWKSGNKNVHFLWLEGANTATSSRVSDATLPHNNLAKDKDVGATVWSLEHRFRGKSLPYKKAFNSNYASALSVGQAIEDVANFIKTQNKDLGANPKWVLFGENYGATLGLWFRQKYPGLTYGIVADSAAIVPTEDFHGFEQFVEQVYSNYSYHCWHAVKFAAIAIRNEIQYENGVDRLNDELKMSPPIDDTTVDYKSMQHVHHNLLSLFETPVVFNNVNTGPFAGCCGVAALCATIGNSTFSLHKERYIDKVFDLAKMLYKNTHGGKDDWPGIDNDYEKTKRYLTDESQVDGNQASARSWLYQQCYEMGQFITTDSGKSLFASTVPEDYFVGLCTDVFGATIFAYTAQDLAAAVAKTKAKYATSQTYTDANATIFYGGTDPTSLLGVKKVTGKASTLNIVPDVGNAAVLKPPHVKDKYPLTFARVRVLTNAVKNLVKDSKKKKKKEVNKEEDEEKETLTNSRTAEEQEEFMLPKVKNWLGRLESRPAEYHDEENLMKRQDKDLKHEPVPMQILRGAVTFSGAVKRWRQANPKVGPVENPQAKKRRKRALDTQYIVQDIDHFDPNYGWTFNQRYLKNANFQRYRDCARFLMLGGEQMIDWSYVDDDLFQYYRWAKDFKGIVYALEHRFFGYSQPFQNTSLQYLRFLTVEQTIVDAAVFINTMNVYENNTNPKWILFGGSYAGNLVAAHRLAFPRLTLGAIASSAPMQAKTDFYEYMQRVEKDIRSYAPYSCPADLRSFFAWNRAKLITRDGRKEIKSAFCLPNHWDQQYIDEKDAQLFIAELVYGVDEVIQLDEIYGQHQVLTRMCGDIKQFNYERYARKARRNRKDPKNRLPMPGKEMDGTKNMRLSTGVKPDDRDDYYEGDSNYYDYDDSVPSRYSDSESGEPEIICPMECYGRCRLPVSYNRLITSIQNIYRDYYYDVYYERFGHTDEARLWLWMSCTTWGFAQSTNYGYNIYESGLPVNFVLDLCADVFGPAFNRSRMQSGVDRTNRIWGGQNNYKGTKVFFINHSEDPWSPLGPAKPEHPNFRGNTTTYTSIGSNHINDMFREFEHDLKGIKTARKIAKRQMIRWIRRKEFNTPSPDFQFSKN